METEIKRARDPTEELGGQMNKAAMLSNCLRDIIWKNKYMWTDSKPKIYKTCCSHTALKQEQTPRKQNKNVKNGRNEDRHD